MTTLMLMLQRRKARKVLKLARLLVTLDEHARAVRAPHRPGGGRSARLTAV